jgi:hypothetical protein
LGGAPSGRPAAWGTSHETARCTKFSVIVSRPRAAGDHRSVVAAERGHDLPIHLGGEVVSVLVSPLSALYRESLPGNRMAADLQHTPRVGSPGP